MELSDFERELKDMLEEASSILGEASLRLVKGKRKKEAMPDVVVTAFHHFCSVAVAAAKLCFEMIDRGRLPEEAFDKCFWGGFLHDYEKVWGGVRDIIKKVPLQEEEVERLAVCAESPMGLDREHRLMCYAIMLSDYWVSQRTLTAWLPDDERYKTALESLERLGLRIVPLFSGLPKAIMAVASEKLLELLFEKGWSALFLYSDGILLVGGEDSEQLSTDEVAEIIYDALVSELQGGTSQRAGIEKGYKPFLEFVARVEQLLPLNEDELRERFERAKEDKKYRKEILPIYSVALIKGYYYLAREIAEYVRKNKKHLQVRSLIGEPYYFEEVEKVGAEDELLNNATDDLRKAVLTAFVLAFKAKNKFDKRLTKWLDFEWSEVRQKKPHQPLLFAEAFAMLYKTKKYEEVIDELRKGGKKGKDEGLWLYSKYLACNALSSSILKKEGCNLPKPKGKCFICGAPVYSTTFTFDKYYAYAQGISKGGVEIYTPRQTPFMNIEKAKKERYICPGCAFEAAFINKKLGSPFVSYGAQPSIAYELMKSFVIPKLNLFNASLRDLIENKVVEGGEGYYVVDYSHALALVRASDLKRGEKGFEAKTEAIAKFLAKAGFLIEEARGGQISLTWELPMYLASEAINAPRMPSWLTYLIDLSLVKADTLAPLVHGLKAWARKVSVTRESDELREAFFSSDLSPHPSLALLSPPRGMRGELERFYPAFSFILKEVLEVEKYMSEEDRLIPRLWAYAKALAETLPRSQISKHKVQSPLRTALYRYVEYLEEGLKQEDALELAAAAAQEDANRKLGNVNIEGPVKGILKFVSKYVPNMNPSKRRQFFEDILDAVYLMTLKAMRGEKS